MLAAGVSLFLGVLATPLFGDGEARGVTVAVSSLSVPGLRSYLAGQLAGPSSVVGISR